MLEVWRRLTNLTGEFATAHLTVVFFNFRSILAFVMQVCVCAHIRHGSSDGLYHPENTACVCQCFRNLPQEFLLFGEACVDAAHEPSKAAAKGVVDLPLMAKYVHRDVLRTKGGVGCKTIDVHDFERKSKQSFETQIRF